MKERVCHLSPVSTENALGALPGTGGTCPRDTVPLGASENKTSQCCPGPVTSGRAQGSNGVVLFLLFKFASSEQARDVCREAV